MKIKIIDPKAYTVQHYPYLCGCVDSDGWVEIHNKSFRGQRASIAALNFFHTGGHTFDIVTVDSDLFTDVSVNDAHVKIEYNVGKTLETMPPNGIAKWRLASRIEPVQPVSTIVDYKTNPTPAESWSRDEASRQCFSKGSLTQAELYRAGLEPNVGPFYANDKYKREIKPGVFVDVYDVIDCFEVTSGALQHAVKKLLAAGKRGHKDYEQDLIDILSSVERALFQHQEKTK